MTSKLCFKSTANCSAQPKSFNMEKFATALCLLVAVAGIRATDLSDSLTNGASTATELNTTVSDAYEKISTTLDGVTVSEDNDMSSALAESLITSIKSLANDLYSRFLESVIVFQNALAAIESYAANSTSTDTNATSCATSSATTMISDFNTTASDALAFLDTLHQYAETGTACTTNLCVSVVVNNVTENTSTEFSAAMDGMSDFKESWSNVTSVLTSCANDSN